MTTKNVTLVNPAVTDRANAKNNKLIKQTAPFILFSLRNAFITRYMPRRKFHLLIYWMILFIYSTYFFLSTSAAIIYPENLPRAIALVKLIEVILVIGILKSVSDLRSDIKPKSADYLINVCSAICLRSAFYFSMVYLPSLAQLLYLRKYDQPFWHFDDMIMLSSFCYVIALWHGYSFIKREDQHETK